LNTQKLHNLFPTPLYWSSAEGFELSSILSEFEQQRSSIDRSLSHVHNHGYDAPRLTDEYAQRLAHKTYGLTHSQQFIDRSVEEYCGLLGYDNCHLKLRGQWFHRNDPGAQHIWHSHPHAVISGTLYYRVPAGDIEFRSPDPWSRANSWPNRDAYTPVIGRTPQPGDIGLWPAHIEHRVSPNNSKQPRYAMSFDYVHAI
jgi:uncharacterized protein (TIGR02466 family)